MPTQIPAGSALAVKQQAGSGRRRKSAPGPKRLKFAEGGQVGDFKNWEQKLDGRMPDPPLEPKPSKEGSPDVLGRMKEMVGGIVPKGGGAPGGGAAGGPSGDGAATGGGAAVEELPIEAFAKGGLVKRKKKTMPGPRRLAYADGGMVSRTTVTQSDGRGGIIDRGDLGTADKLDKELQKTGKQRIKT